MRKYFTGILCIAIFVIAFMLAGCAQMTSITDNISNKIADIKAAVTPLEADELCALKMDDLSIAKQRYSGNVYIFTGSVFATQSRGDYDAVGINDGGSKVFAKVYHSLVPAHGATVKIKGKVSDANFTADRRSNCMILLDDAVIVQ